MKTELTINNDLLDSKSTETTISVSFQCAKMH